MRQSNRYTHTHTCGNRIRLIISRGKDPRKLGVRSLSESERTLTRNFRKVGCIRTIFDLPSRHVGGPGGGAVRTFWTGGPRLWGVYSSVGYSFWRCLCRNGGISQREINTKMVLETRNNICNHGKNLLPQTMSSNVPIVIDPEALTGLEQLANASFLQVTDIPEVIRSHLPPETAPIPILLETKIPTRLPKISIIQPVHLCTSPLDPRWTADELFKTSLPPRTWLYALEESLSQIWISGIRSIKPPSSSSPDLRFPLWIANFWNIAVEVAEQRDQWKAAGDWLSRRVQDSEICRARNLLENVPWGLRLWSLAGHDKETRVGYLAGLLSNEWLGERHIDTISSYLNTRVQRECSRPTSLVADLDLQTYLSNNSRATAEKIQAHDGLRTYAQRILDHRYSRLFIPAHVGGNHWIVFSVDFEKHTFEYGEFA